MLVEVTAAFLVVASDTDEAKAIVGDMIRGDEMMTKQFHIFPETKVISL